MPIDLPISFTNGEEFKVLMLKERECDNIRPLYMKEDDRAITYYEMDLNNSVYIEQGLYYYVSNTPAKNGLCKDPELNKIIGEILGDNTLYNVTFEENGRYYILKNFPHPKIIFYK